MNQLRDELEFFVLWAENVSHLWLYLSVLAQLPVSVA
jgi:hypothetical protein